MSLTLGRFFLEGIALGNPRALVVARGDREFVHSAAQVSGQVHRCALALLRRGFARGDRAAILAENRPEWLIADFGTTFAGGAVVPLYMNLLAAQVAAILADSRPRIAFVSTPEQADKLRKAVEDWAEKPEVVLMDAPEGVAHSWERFLASGAPKGDDPPLPALAERQGAEDLATIIYTSGSTGEPKGVDLTHGNLTACEAGIEVLGAEPGREVLLSFLPLAHVFGRTTDLCLFCRGASICYEPSLERLGPAFKRHRPTVFGSVPRVFEKAYAAVQARVAASPAWRRKLSAWAFGVGLRAQALRERGRAPAGLLVLEHALADRLIFRRVREGMGGRLRYTISGGAPLSQDILRFFLSVGVNLYEGYGMTECAVIAVNRPDRWRVGTVGPPLPNLEVRIAEDGEILVKGPLVARGFHGREDLTPETFDAGGWLHTGDLGKLEDGFLSITGRKKELMKTAGGKYIAPAALERILLGLPLVSQAMAVADGRPYPSALVVPNLAVLRTALMDQGLGSAPPEVLCADPKALAWIEAQIETAMAPLPRYERVKRVALLPTPFTVETGELTPTLKLRRGPILQKHAAEVEAIYGRPGGQV